MRYAITLLLALALVGCKKQESHDHEHDHEHEHEDHDEHGHDAHAHVAPHDGLLVELGDHAANVEFVLDAETGTLTAYLLGAHASEPVRSDAKSIEVTVDGNAHKLMPVEDTLSGEKIGDTSTFRVQHDSLKGLKTFKGRVGKLTLMGTVFDAVDFTYSTD